MGAEQVANAADGKTLGTKNASRKIVRARRYRWAGVTLWSFRIQRAKKMVPEKKAAIPLISNGSEYELRKLFATRTLIACMLALERRNLNALGEHWT